MAGVLPSSVGEVVEKEGNKIDIWSVVSKHLERMER